MSSLAQTASTPVPPASDPNLAALPGGHGSRLSSNGVVVIAAPIATALPNDPVTTNPPQCYSVSNATKEAYFVPWNSPQEWSAFLSAIGAGYQLAGTSPPENVSPLGYSVQNGQPVWSLAIFPCCPVQQVGALVDATGNTCTNPNGTPIFVQTYLGTRFAGTTQSLSAPSYGEEPYYGVQGDVQGPINASAYNPALNYTVTYVCKNGQWVETHGSGQGSCAPVNGQCADGSSNLTSLPTDLSLLCAPGSIETGLTGGASGPWTWDCLGTPGMANASCASGPVNAVCGAAEGQNLAAAPTLSSDLCAVGTYNGDMSDNLSSWNWSCSGFNGGAGAGCFANNSNPVPQCGTANGAKYTQAPDTQAELCAVGYPQPVTDQGGNLYTWSCAQFSDGTGSVNCSTKTKLSMTVTLAAIPNTVVAGQTIELIATVVSNDNVSGFYAAFDAWNDDMSFPQYWTNSLDFKKNKPTSVVYDLQIPSDAESGTYGAWVGIYDNIGDQWGSAQVTFTVIDGSDGSSSDNNNNGNTTNTNAQCGVAAGVATAITPSIGLCAVGSSTGVSDNGSGEWIWSCSSSDGTSTLCGAPNSGVGAGICGSASNTTIPDMPNQNLCSSGSASAVTGTGPWQWTCLGEQQYAGQNQSCEANICQACTGTVTSSMTGSLTTAKMSSNGCMVNGVASWTETDVYSQSGNSVWLQWSDPFYGTFSQLLAYSGAPAGYCPPCYRSAQSVSNAQVTVQAVAGSCPADAEINSGNPVTYNASGVTLTP